jgi:ADP-ribosylglycohydrolase
METRTLTTPAPETDTLSDAVVGCLLGTAVGDAIGLPAEGLSRRRQHRLFGGDIEGHRLLFGRGMVSDDTEHADLTARALLASGGDPDRFAAELARSLKTWLLLLPAGVGLATLRACLRLLVGVPPDRSGVASAGNGPAMRAALLGVCYGHDLQRLRALVRASARLTHTDSRAEYGALLVAWAAHLSAQGRLTPRDLLLTMNDILPGDAAGTELGRLITAGGESALRREPTPRFAEQMGWGERVSGYVYQTVPVALQAALLHPRDLRAAVKATVACGGDTDSVAAITGGIVGAGVGPAGVPSDWLAGMAEWPRSPRYLERLGGALADGSITRQAPSLPVPALAARNAAFTAVVLCHGLRRLLPPY